MCNFYLKTKRENELSEEGGASELSKLGGDFPLLTWEMTGVGATPSSSQSGRATQLYLFHFWSTDGALFARSQSLYLSAGLKCVFTLHFRGILLAGGKGGEESAMFICFLLVGPWLLVLVISLLLMCYVHENNYHSFCMCSSTESVRNLHYAGIYPLILLFVVYAKNCEYILLFDDRLAIKNLFT